MATFGRTTYNNTAGCTANYILCARYTLSGPGIVTKMGVYWAANNATIKTRTLIYAAGAANTPGALYGYSNEVTGIANTGYSEYTMTSPISLAAGDYYLAVTGDTTVANPALNAQSATGDNVYKNYGTYPQYPNPWVTTGQGTGTNNYAIFATYDPPVSEDDSNMHLIYMAGFSTL